MNADWREQKSGGSLTLRKGRAPVFFPTGSGPGDCLQAFGGCIPISKFR